MSSNALKKKTFRKFGLSVFKLFLVLVMMPLITLALGMGYAFGSFYPLYAVLGLCLLSLWPLIKTSNEVFLYDDYFLIVNEAVFWHPRLRFDFDKVRNIKLDTSWLMMSNHFKLVIEMKDGRRYSYYIFERFEKVVHHFEKIRNRLGHKFTLQKIHFTG